MKKTALLLIAALMMSGSAFAAGYRTYEVTITNITGGQIFTPVLAATHKNDISFFELGEAASPELEMQAEGGDPSDLKAMLDSMPSSVLETVALSAPIMPGDSATFEIGGTYRYNRLSFSAMLVPTNDSFVALNAMVLPYFNGATTAAAYDAGTEVNDEDCDSIPGPCGGEGYSMDGGEGYVYVSNGIHGIADLAPQDSDWRNPVAKVSIRRVR